MGEIVRKVGQVRDSGQVTEVVPWDDDRVTHFRLVLVGRGKAFDFMDRRSGNEAARAIEDAYNCGRVDLSNDLRKLIGAA